MISSRILPLLLALAVGSVRAYGCTKHITGHCADGINHTYDPDDGMICDPHDCGGGSGSAPPKTDDPCCRPAYTGTAQCAISIAYMPCFTRSSLPYQLTTMTTITTGTATGTAASDSSTVTYTTVTSPTTTSVTHNDDGSATTTRTTRPLATSDATGTTTVVSFSATSTPNEAASRQHGSVMALMAAIAGFVAVI